MEISQQSEESLFQQKLKSFLQDIGNHPYEYSTYETVIFFFQLFYFSNRNLFVFSKNKNNRKNQSLLKKKQPLKLYSNKNWPYLIKKEVINKSLALTVTILWFFFFFFFQHLFLFWNFFFLKTFRMKTLSKRKMVYLQFLDFFNSFLDFWFFFFQIRFLYETSASLWWSDSNGNF